MDQSLADAYARLDELRLHDERRLRRGLDGVRKIREPQARELALDSIATELARAEQTMATRRSSAPPIRYPGGLPILERKDDIAALINDNQVVIVAGETGSGKTTQLPKICLELGRGLRGIIGHTQPRRIAARSVAQRICDELGVNLGAAVGYKVRFTDRASATTQVKLMTDGILLAEMQRDRMLLDYDTLIIDEAHERSLNIDFILGYLRQLLPKRPDLKVIVTSATIDPDRFSQHFGGAPIIEVSGRTYPVEVRYRPLDESTLTDENPDAASGRREPRDQIQGICDAVHELCAAGPGDVLVFLSGEREIRDTADALRELFADRLEVLPLYARLSNREQQRIFEPHAQRRVVLATNVAETSLTVPGIRYVVDPGTARISRYNRRTKVQRLPIEAISQASADQRKGRCGRTSDGICIRLYSADDFDARSRFTDPEILRTNLASVILHMAALGLGDIAAFPFVDPPDRRHIKDGVQLLEELGALEPAASGQTRQARLTELGRKLAPLPVDPRLARMIVAAGENSCASEVIVIAAALSIVDPRERPADAQAQADELHARFADPTSDFLGFLNMWNYLRERQEALSSSAFRRLCRSEYLNYLRVREWQDVESQLRQVALGIGVRPNDSPAPPDAIHQALLSGLLSHVGLRDVKSRDFLGARGARFGVHRSSALAKKPPQWVMAAELVETGRLWGRVCARIEPDWIEPLAAHLVNRTYSEPHWDRRRGAVMAFERVTLYGLSIIESRRIGYAKVDPAVARELFIRHALVEGDWSTHHAFVRANAEFLAELGELEVRARRRDVMPDDEALFDFFDARLPTDIVSARHFDSWWKKARRTTPDLLTLDREALPGAVELPARSQFPDQLRFGDLDLDLSYVFEPGNPDDGVTVHVPVSVLNRVTNADLSWHVPGYRQELLTAMLRGLPKPIRRTLVPLPDVAAELLPQLRPADGSLAQALSRALLRLRGADVAPADFDAAALPDHLRLNIAAINPDAVVLARGRNLDDVRGRVRLAMRAAINAAAGHFERHGLRAWEFGTIPAAFEQQHGGFVVRGFPALVDERDSVGLTVLETETLARAAHVAGVRRLLLLNVGSPAKALQRQLSNDAKLALSRHVAGSATDLLDDCLVGALDELMTSSGAPPRDDDTFAALLAKVRGQLGVRLAAVVTTAIDVVVEAAAVRAQLDRFVGRELGPAIDDMRAQVQMLAGPGFVGRAGAQRLGDVARYVRAISRRLEKLPGDVGRDRARMTEVHEAWQAYEAARAAHGGDPRVEALRWMVEELRVSLFAQTLGTPAPVSLTRILRAAAGLAS